MNLSVSGTAQSITYVSFLLPICRVKNAYEGILWVYIPFKRNELKPNVYLAVDVSF